MSEMRYGGNTGPIVIGTCSRCGGPVTVNGGPAACASCRSQAKSSYGPIIETVPSIDKTLLLETTKGT